VCIGIDDDEATGPDDGCIERDADGRPTGLLFEKADVMDSLLAADVHQTADHISDALQVVPRALRRALPR